MTPRLIWELTTGVVGAEAEAVGGRAVELVGDLDGHTAAVDVLEGLGGVLTRRSGRGCDRQAAIGGHRDGVGALPRHLYLGRVGTGRQVVGGLDAAASPK